MRRLPPSLAVAIALALAPIPARAQGPIPSLDLSRSGDDLILTWGAVPGADGYRVYRSTTHDCSDEALAYDGPDTTWTEPGTMSDPQPRIYQVVSYLGALEGPRSGPAYKYGIDLRSGGPMLGNNFVSFPPWIPGLDGIELCAALNPGIPGDDVRSVLVYRNCVTRTQNCVSSINAITSLRPGEGFDLRPAYDHALAAVFGHAHPEWHTVLTDTCPMFLLSLPWDHAYGDLLALASDFPDAVAIELFDHRDGSAVGIRRVAPGRAWFGTNLPLDDRRGEAVRIWALSGIDWRPRRLCGVPCPVPLPRLAPLLATRVGGDVHLRYPANLQSSGGYYLYRVSDRSQIPDVRTGPFHLWDPARAPTLPLVDAGAIADPAPTLFYQIVARCASGEMGDL